jgi:hypothetical protein
MGEEISAEEQERRRRVEQAEGAAFGRLGVNTSGGPPVSDEATMMREANMLAMGIANRSRARRGDPMLSDVEDKPEGMSMGQAMTGKALVEGEERRRQIREGEIKQEVQQPEQFLMEQSEGALDIMLDKLASLVGILPKSGE